MRKYEYHFIDRSTLYLISAYETERKTKVVTTNGVMHSSLSAAQLIERTCMLYASPCEERVKANRFNQNQHTKTPIVISIDGVAAFPTTSPSHPECIWIFNHDYRTEKISPSRTRIIYEKYGIVLDLDASIHTLEKQRKRMHEMLYYYMKVRKRHNT